MQDEARRWDFSQNNKATQDLTGQTFRRSDDADVSTGDRTNRRQLSDWERSSTSTNTSRHRPFCFCNKRTITPIKQILIKLINFQTSSSPVYSNQSPPKIIVTRLIQSNFLKYIKITLHQGKFDAAAKHQFNTRSQSTYLIFNLEKPHHIFKHLLWIFVIKWEPQQIKSPMPLNLW